MEYPRISIVTPCFNQAPYLEATIRSVLEQGYPNLEYIIIDGGSTDGSLEIIHKYEDQLAYFVSEPDQGQYHAVQKGFAQCSGEIMAWINADDLYHHGAFQAVARIFREMPDVRWLQGHPTEFSPEGMSLNRVNLPWARWSRKRYLSWDFQFIQQESCFWRRSLWEEAGGEMSMEYSLAGDLELWTRFFRHAPLFTTMIQLAGFRYRQGQRSREQRREYLWQCAEIITKERSSLDIFSRMSLSIQRVGFFPLSLAFFFEFPLLKRLYPIIYKLPPVIRYDPDRDRFHFSSQRVKHPPLWLFGRQVARNVPKSPKQISTGEDK